MPAAIRNLSRIIGYVNEMHMAQSRHHDYIANIHHSLMFSNPLTFKIHYVKFFTCVAIR